MSISIFRPKRWAMRYRTDDSEVKENVKCCGIALKQINCNDIDADSFIQILTEHKKELRVNQVQQMKNKTGSEREPRWTTKQLIFDRHSDRRCFFEHLFLSLPWGYSLDQLNHLSQQPNDDETNVDLMTMNPSPPKSPAKGPSNLPIMGGSVTKLLNKKVTSSSNVL